MAAPPSCRAMGSHCRALRVTLRVGSLEDGVASLDHEATWLLGHTQHITFDELWEDEGDLYADAVLHVACRYLAADNGTARCTAHGYRGRPPLPRRYEQPRQLGGDRFLVVDRMHEAVRELPHPTRPRVLPVVNAASSANPCATAPCTTADHKRGAACCRDLQVEIMCTKRQQHLEALVRARRSPYLCKVTRGGDFSIDAEMISACGYLEEDSVNCTLHGRVRADGRPAKPDLCSEWPTNDKDQVLHPGCVFAKGR